MTTAISTIEVEPLPFPIKVLDQHVCVLGKTGSGKSSVLRLIAEYLLYRNKRLCILDPKGDWAGIKVTADGKSTAFPVVAFGDFKDERAQDVPINPRNGKEIAELVATGNRPCVIGFRGWSTHQMQMFFIDFASVIFAKNAGELILVGDEFHNFAPKGKVLSPQAGESLHWANRLLSEGRGLGIVCLIASQRPQKVHNDTLTSCETLIAMRVIHAADRNAVKDWLDGAGDKEMATKVLMALAMMPRGDGYVWSPEIGFGPKLISFPMFKTFDSFAPPQLQKKISSAGWAKIDLGEVEKKLAAVIEEHKAKDPKALAEKLATANATILRLERTAGSAAPAAKPSPAIKFDASTIKAAERAIAMLNQGIAGAVAIIEKLSITTTKITDSSAEMVTKVQSLETALGYMKSPTTFNTPQGGHNPAAAPAVTGHTTSPAGAGGVGAHVLGRGKKSPQDRILYALRWWQSVSVASPTVSQLAPVAGYAPSGSFDTYLSRMGTAGLIERSSGVVTLLAEGAKLAPPQAAPPSLASLHVTILAKLDGPQTTIITALIGAGGRPLTVEELATASNYAVSGSFDTYLSRLGTRGLIERKKGVVTPTAVLYPPGLR